MLLYNLTVVTNKYISHKFKDTFKANKSRNGVSFFDSSLPDSRFFSSV